MADTIITPMVRDDRSSGADAMGWAVASMLLLGLVLFGIFVWPGVNNSVTPANTNPGIDLNVRLPEGTPLPGANTNTQVAPQNTGTQTQ